MALQIRRGPTADRMSYTPVVGELIWDTSTNSLYIGNGTTTGGLPAGTLVTEDVQDIASSMLVDGTHNNIAFTYVNSGASAGTINVQVDLTTYDGTIEAPGFKGSVYASDSSLLLNALTGAVNLDGTIKGNVVPDANETYDLGSASYRFRDIYLSGSSINLGAATITATGSVVDLPAGSTVDGVLIGSGSGTGDGVVEGSSYRINILSSDNSTIMLNNDAETITASGGIFGNVTGDISGTHTGPVVTNSISSADSSDIVFDTRVTFQTDVRVEGTLRVVDGSDFQSTEFSSFPLAVTAAHEDDQPTRVVLRRSRGTIDTPTSLINNDRVGSIQFNGHDGTTYRSAASIQTRVAGTVSTGIVPSELRFLVTNTLGEEIESTRIQPQGTTYHFSNASTISPLVLQTAHNAGVGSNLLNLQRSRGTTTSPTASNTGDALFGVAFQGHDGTSFITAGTVRGVVDGTVTTGAIPGRLEFITANSSGVFAINMVLDKDGVLAVNTLKGRSTPYVSFNQMPVLPTYADEAAANLAVTTPVNGMMYYDSGSGKIKGYQGSAWVVLAP